MEARVVERATIAAKVLRIRHARLKTRHETFRQAKGVRPIVIAWAGSGVLLSYLVCMVMS